jgi:lysozyme
MTTSPNGLNFIKKNEGFKAKLYKDSGGYSIGYGTFLSTPALVAKYQKRTLTESEATMLMLERVELIEASINKHVKVPITQNEFDALVDFSYNEGIGAFQGSTLLKLLNAGNYDGAAEEFKVWDVACGKHNDGLEARRIEDEELFKRVS